MLPRLVLACRKSSAPDRLCTAAAASGVAIRSLAQVSMLTLQWLYTISSWAGSMTLRQTGARGDATARHGSGPKRRAGKRKMHFALSHAKASEACVTMHHKPNPLCQAEMQSSPARGARQQLT